MNEKKDNFEAFVNVIFTAFKTLALKRGFDDETIINAAYHTTMFIVADAFIRIMGLNPDNKEDFKIGYDKAEEWIIHIGEEIQKERKNRKKG